MARHRRSGIGAGIEGWMKADKFEREFLLKQKRQEASIRQGARGLGLDERRVQLAEGRFGLEEQLFPSLLKTQEAGAASAEIKTEEQRRGEDLAKRLDVLESKVAPTISPTIPVGAPAGAAARLEPYVDIEERIQKLEEETGRREAESAEDLATKRAGVEAGRAEVDIAGTGAVLKEGVPRKVAVATAAKAETEAATAGYQAALIKAREDNDLPALEAEVAGKILNLAEQKEIAEIDRALADAKLRNAQAEVAGKEKLKDDMIRKAYQAKGADYDQVLIDTHEVKSGLVMSSDDIIDNIQKAEASMTRVLQLPSADDPAMQAILDENPIYAFFMKPTADKAGAVEGLRKFIRVMKTRLKRRWGLDYDELAGTIPTTTERSAAVDELRRSRQ